MYVCMHACSYIYVCMHIHTHILQHAHFTGINKPLQINFYQCQHFLNERETNTQKGLVVDENLLML